MDEKSKNQGKTLAELKAKREWYVNRLFFLMIEFLVIFGLPALGAYFLGKHLDSQAGGGYFWTASTAITAFILSWLVVIYRLRMIMRQLKQMDSEIEAVKKQSI